MRMPRVTIGQLMVVVVFLAFGLSALFRPTRLGAMILTGSLLMALTISLIGVVVDRGRRRAFLVGFLIAGWSTILMCYWADLSDIFTDWWTADPMDSSVGAISNPAALLPSNGVTPTPTTPGPAAPLPGTIAPFYHYYSFYLPRSVTDPGLTGRDLACLPRTVTMLLAWSAATAGGLVARWLFMTRRDHEIGTVDGRPV